MNTRNNILIGGTLAVLAVTTWFVVRPLALQETRTGNNQQVASPQTVIPDAKMKALQANPQKHTTTNRVLWQPSYEAAFAEAKRTGKPVMIDFYTTWCPPCKILDQFVYTHPKFINAAQDWIMLKVDAERNELLARLYRVTAYPTILFLAQDGKLLIRQEGFAIAEKYLISQKSINAEMTRQMIKTMNNARDKANRRPNIST